MVKSTESEDSHILHSHTKLARVVTLANLLVSLQSIITQVEDLEAALTIIAENEIASADWVLHLAISKSHLSGSQQKIRETYLSALRDVRDIIDEVE